jgi:hypothetical protein
MVRIVICMGLYYGWCRWNGTPTPNFFLSGGGGSGFSFGLDLDLESPEIHREAREGNELTHVRTSIKGKIKKRGRERGRI